MAKNSLRTQKTQRPGQKREQRNKFKDVKYIIRAWINNAMIYRKMFSLLNLCRWFLEVLHLVAINLLRSYRFPTTLCFFVFFPYLFLLFATFYVVAINRTNLTNSLQLCNFSRLQNSQHVLLEPQFGIWTFVLFFFLLLF